MRSVASQLCEEAHRGGDLRVRCSMSAAFKMWLSHLDNGLTCVSSARASAWYGCSVQDVSFASGRGHGSPLGMPPFA
jgi:hypothetical protein